MKLNSIKFVTLVGDHAFESFNSIFCKDFFINLLLFSKAVVSELCNYLSANCLPIKMSLHFYGLFWSIVNLHLRKVITLST